MRPTNWMNFLCDLLTPYDNLNYKWWCPDFSWVYKVKHFQNMPQNCLSVWIGKVDNNSKMAQKSIGILVLIFVWVKYSQANDFPSLLVANATMGIRIIIMMILKYIFLLVQLQLNRCYHWPRIPWLTIWKNIWSAQRNHRTGYTRRFTRCWTQC